MTGCVRKAAPVVCVLLVMIASCSHKTTWVVGGSGKLCGWDRSDVKEGIAVASRFTTAWCHKDYGLMFALESPRAADYSAGRFAIFRRWASTWRERGAPKQVGIKEPVVPRGIIDSFSVLGNVTDPQAQILLALALGDEKVFDQLKKKEWPERAMFVHHSIVGKPYIMMLVKERGRWAVMNAPGTYPEPPSLVQPRR